METLLEKLIEDFPIVHFVEGPNYYWSPATKQIFYKANAHNDSRINNAAAHALLHEVAHALLEHQTYHTDFELIRMERDAWEHAKALGNKYDFEMDENHIQDCLDSYRDWLYKRSICPTCGTKSIQCDEVNCYRCFNCHTQWKVSQSRFCRPYRQFKLKSRPLATLDTASALLY